MSREAQHKQQGQRCPVCGSPDVADYRSTDTVCGCCGTDLSVFHAIHRVDGECRKAQKNAGRWRAAAGVALVAAVVAAAVVLLLYFSV